MSYQDWLDRQPDPKTAASTTSAADVLQLLEAAPETTVVLDVRNERGPAVLKNSVGIPVTDLSDYSGVKTELIDRILASNPKTKTIVVHCNSSRRRATITAGWIQDYITENSVSDYTVTVLEGGIAAWYALDEPYKSYLVPFP